VAPIRRPEPWLAGTTALGGGIVPPGFPSVQWSVAAADESSVVDGGSADAGSLGGFLLMFLLGYAKSVKEAF
jgi:hypothetical protein